MTKQERARDLRLRRQYGITSAEFAKVLEYQGFVCAICKRPPKEGKNLHIDHNHKSGQTRGLLEWQCNAALAKFRDDKVRLENAVIYIHHPPVTEALGREVFGRTGRVTNKRKRKRARKGKKK